MQERSSASDAPAEKDAASTRWIVSTDENWDDSDQNNITAKIHNKLQNS